ncbi:unnamed protein product [Closterium sp. Yama58-4]|nr:unnamed protein product [Closterium sp. Yama58-4]
MIVMYVVECNNTAHGTGPVNPASATSSWSSFSVLVKPSVLNTTNDTMSFLPSFLFPTLAPSPPLSTIEKVLSDDYLLSLVLRSLTRDSFHYALVSKRWYAAARFSLAHLVIKSKIRFPVLLDTIRTFSSLTRLELQECRVQDSNGDALFQCLSAACPHLTHLTIHYQFRMHVTCNGLSSLFHGCRKIRDLRLLTLHSLPHLPSAVTLLSDLRTLHLCRCYEYYGVDRFEHIMSPPESIGALQQLQEFRVITGSQFRGLPDAISSLTNLRSLTFSNRSFSQLPTSIADLPHLQTLKIEMDKLKVIPDSFEHLTGLRSFSLQSKRVKRVPEHVLGAMVRLKSLYLCCKSIQSLPDSICCLALSSLSILSSPVISSLPDNLGALVQLETLKLCNLPNLQYLPESMGDLPRLRSLEINQLGLLQLPEKLCTGSVRHSLEGLYLCECRELRQLPPQFGMLTRLEELDITSCSRLESLEPLLAPYPPMGAQAQAQAQQPWGLASLTSLSLCRCSRIPSLPDSFSMLSALSSLTLTHMHGLSNLPESLGELVSLRSLKLQYSNKLSSLPESLGQLKNLETLELCYLPELNSLPGSLRWLPKLKEPLLIDVVDDFDQPNDVYLSRAPEDVIISRNGAVLGKKTILKSDHFPGCQNKRLLPHIDGAPNFRQIADLPVYGVAIPTVEGIRNVLQIVGASRNGGRHVLWHSMREEPVIYINGRPFVLREVERPFTNLEYTGINRARVEQMEARLKKDVLREAARYSNKIMVSDELPDGQMVDQWEPVGPDSVQTPLEVYEDMQRQGYNVDYERVPVTDEKVPEEVDFDLLVESLSSVDEGTAQIFNCQMGRGRTTTGTVVATLICLARRFPSRILSPSAGATMLAKAASTAGHEPGGAAKLMLGAATTPGKAHGAAEGAAAAEAAEVQAEVDRVLLAGQYAVIRSLTRVLEAGSESKRLTDLAIDHCASMQNLREAILGYRNRIHRHSDEKRRQAALNLFVAYLERYYMLVCFSAFLHSLTAPHASTPSSLTTSQALPSPSPSLSLSHSKADDAPSALGRVQEPPTPGRERLSLVDGVAATQALRDAKGGFQRWMKARPELYSILRRLLRRDPMGALGYAHPKQASMPRALSFSLPHAVSSSPTRDAATAVAALHAPAPTGTASLPAVAAAGQGEGMEVEGGDVEAGDVAGEAFRMAEMAAAIVEARSGAMLSKQVRSGAMLSKQVRSGAMLSKQVRSGAMLSKQVRSGAMLSKQVRSGAMLSKQVRSGAMLSKQVRSGAMLSKQVRSEAMLSKQVRSGAMLSKQVRSGAMLSKQVLLVIIHNTRLDVRARQHAHASDALIIPLPLPLLLLLLPPHAPLLSPSLPHQTVLKSDHCPGCQNLSLPELLEGAPNFRQVQGFPVFGVANPTVDGIRAVLRRVAQAVGGTGAEGVERRVVWHNMREEATVYINGKPFVLREAERPFKNMLEYTGIDRQRVERMEARLKGDVEREAQRSGGMVVVDHESDAGELFHALEPVPVPAAAQGAHGAHGACVQTPLEVFRMLQREGFRVDYHRLPTTDGEPPKSRDFDALATSISSAGPHAAFVFNCQMGRGRTTTGTVTRMLEGGAAARHVLDGVVDRCAQMLNIREAILSYRRAFNMQVPWGKGRVRTRGCGVGMVGVKEGGWGKLCADAQYPNAFHHLAAPPAATFTSSQPVPHPPHPHCQDADARTRQSALSRGAEFLERYVMLIAFAAYLSSPLFRPAAPSLWPRSSSSSSASLPSLPPSSSHTALPRLCPSLPAATSSSLTAASGEAARSDAGDGGAEKEREEKHAGGPSEHGHAKANGEGEGGEGEGEAVSFKAWLKRRPEIRQMKWGLRLRPARLFTIPEVGVRLRDSDASASGAAGAVEEREAEDAVLRARRGAVLGRGSILKLSLFPGLQPSALNYSIQIPHVPNYFEAPGYPVHSMATPTVQGAQAVLAHLGAVPQPTPTPPAAATTGGSTGEADGKAEARGEAEVVIVDLREEAVVYVHGKPFVLRDAHQPAAALKHVGIAGSAVAAMEERLKADILQEAARCGGMVLLHKERPREGHVLQGGSKGVGVGGSGSAVDGAASAAGGSGDGAAASPAAAGDTVGAEHTAGSTAPDPPASGATVPVGPTEIIGVWREVGPDDVKTPAQVYGELREQQGYLVDYRRIPLTRERVPVASDVDALQLYIQRRGRNVKFLFVSHTGYGAIAYAMALTCLHLQATTLPSPAPLAPSAAPSSPTAGATPSTSTLAKSASAASSVPVAKAASGGGGKGEYRNVLQLERVLVKGPHCKRLVDAVAHRLLAVGRIVEDAVEYRRAAEAVQGDDTVDRDRRAALTDMGLKALRRYCYLIAYRSYLFSRASASGAASSSKGKAVVEAGGAKGGAGGSGESFGAWVAQRPEIEHMLQHLVLE